MQFISVLKTRNGELLVRDSKEVLIPAEERKEIIEILQANHSTKEAMMAQAKDHFY